MKQMQIGWGQKNITPIGEIGKKVSLIGQYEERVTSVVRDPIQTVAMAIEGEQGETAIIVSADLIMITDQIMEGTRKKLKERLPEFPSEKLIIGATHIHTGPFLSDALENLWGEAFAFPYNDPDVITPEAYLEFLTERIAEAAVDAWNSRKPGGLARKVGRIAVPQSRKIRYKDGSAVMYGKTDDPNFLRVEGNADTGTEYLIAYDENNELTGVLINLACPAQVLEYMNFITADIWGEVRKNWTSCPYVLPLCGAAGDVTMRDLVRRDRIETPMYTEAGMIEQALRIIRESEYVVSTVKTDEIETSPEMLHLVRTITLPLWMATEEEYKDACIQFEMMQKDYKANGFAQKSPDSVPLLQRDLVPYSKYNGLIKRYQMQQESPLVEVELHALRIGETVFVNNPFELYQDFGMQIKGRSVAPQVIIAQLCCGNLGYLPTQYAVDGGSYSAQIFNGYVGPQGGDVLVEKTLQAIYDAYYDPKEQRENPYFYMLPEGHYANDEDESSD